ncbi:30S ribosomal protein S7 [Candidatus Roizmanbacteria bacterium]|nr:30S ribosomal protein S7 [Candidatus Roizmanbacteria bacterium]
MARNKTLSSRKERAAPDPLYGNVFVSKLINRIMRDGKKSVAQKSVYHAFEIIKKHHDNPVEVFQEAIRNISPQVEVRSRRIGGAAYQVPAPVRGPRKLSLALRWLIFEARNRPTAEYKTFSDKLAAEILDAFAGEGGAIKRKDTAHKMAEANKAFSHFRW